MVSIDELVQTAVRREASDIHISSDYSPSLRIDGSVVFLDYPVMNDDDCKNFVFSFMNDNQKHTLDNKGEVDFAYKSGNCRLRVNVYRQNNSVAMAARLLKDVIPTIEELRLPPVLRELQEKRHGIILMTGATGSGKSTSLASIINAMNQRYDYHVITIEEPIEYVYPKGRCIIHQREVGSDTQSFPNALRAALRQDPDVILLGEMRDTETVSTAITASETGHLVLSTLHTIGVVSSIDRIVDVFEPYQQQQVRAQLADVLECVVSQQLIPRADGKGRIVATEIMFANSAVKNHIREGKTYLIPNDIVTARKNGMRLMDDSVYDLYVQGYISKENALFYSRDREAMAKMIF